MTETAIRIEHLSKQYLIGGRQQATNNSLRDVLAQSATAPLRRMAKVLRGQAASSAHHDETFWALKDVSFEIQSGEALGIIGRNGAGKSTLLKILSRITEPTAGRVTLKGRVGSLLEVGTGFHSELTGRENIYLNGAILGMTRAEVNRKLDEIIAFAETEQFIDTAVKHYSSGMYLRLAFAVAAHLEPEILLVDEVLAVGDAGFQKKCLGKMSDVANEGRTVVFVSHNMGAISSLTQRTICLEHGQLIDVGDTKQVIENYLERLAEHISADGWLDLHTVPHTLGTRQAAELDWLQTINSQGKPTGIFFETEPFKVEVGFTVKKPLSGLEFAIDIRTVDGSTSLFRAPSGQYDTTIAPGQYRISMTVQPNYLRAHLYNVGIIMIVRGQREDVVNPALQFTIENHVASDDNPFYAQRLWQDSLFRFNYSWVPMELLSRHS